MPASRVAVPAQAGMRQVATLLAQDSSPRLFAEAAEQVARTFDVPTVWLVRYEPDGSTTLVAGFGEAADTEKFAVGSRWRIDTPRVVATVQQTGRPARVEDSAKLALRGAAVASAGGMRSAVGSPIVVEGRLWGAMFVLSTRPEPLPADTEARLVDFTELLATAIASVESRAAVSRLADEQTALRRVATLVARGVSPADVFAAVTDEVGGLFGAEAAVARFEPDGSAMVVVGLTKGIPVVSIGARWPLEDFLASTAVYRTGRPARNDHTGHRNASGSVADNLRKMDFVSTVAAPIVVEGNLWGVMTVSDRREPLPPDTEERVAKFTELVATAIANAESRAELAVSEARAHAILDAAFDPVITIDHLGRVLEFNRAAERTFGYRKADVLGQELASLVVPDRYREAHRRALARWTEEGPGPGAGAILGKRIEYEGMRADGSVFPADIAISRVDVPGPPLFTACIRDLTSSTEARDALRLLANEQTALRRVATLVAKGASADELYNAVAHEVADVVGIPVVGVNRYEADRTFTILGIAGDTTFTVRSRWPVEEEGLAGLILTTGRPARKEDYSTMSGTLGDAVREDRMVSTVGVPIVVDGVIWGFLVVAGRPGETIPANTEQRLARFTELVATAISNATIRADLLASRARVLAAAHEARRRIERDLHDGAQQRLVTLAVELRNVEAQVPHGLDALRSEVDRVAEGLTNALDELREIAHGIHPAVLSHGGLSPALKALGRRSTVPVDLDLHIGHRLPDEIEVVAYYIVSEALANASKHANAARVWVSVRLEEEDTLHLAIRDDGVGGADPSRGSGLIGLTDRTEALGGAIEIESPVGSGTRIYVRIPVSQDQLMVSPRPSSL